MQQLIDDLLNYARIDKENVEKEEVDMNAIVKDVLHQMNISADKEIEIHLGRLPVVKAIPYQMYELFQNLIGNAVKFRREIVHLKIHVSVEDIGNMWKFSVSDNGTGFDQQYADKVFVLFQRLHNRRSSPGTGIGLAICKKS